MQRLYSDAVFVYSTLVEEGNKRLAPQYLLQTEMRNLMRLTQAVEVLGALQAYCSSYIGCLAGLGLDNQHHADLVRTESHQDLF